MRQSEHRNQIVQRSAMAIAWLLVTAASDTAGLLFDEGGYGTHPSRAHPADDATTGPRRSGCDRLLRTDIRDPTPGAGGFSR